MSPASPSAPSGGRTQARVKSESARAATIASIFLVLTVILAAASLTLGARNISLREVFSALVNEDPSNPAHSVIVDRRLPRTLITMSAGAALSLAGALLQALTRNPLADTGVLGINAGAAFFAALMLSLLGWSSPLIFVVMAIAGATAAITVTYRVALGEKMA